MIAEMQGYAPYAHEMKSRIIGLMAAIHDILRTTIVLLQLEEFGTLQLTLESEDIVDVGTTETIDTACSLRWFG